MDDLEGDKSKHNSGHDTVPPSQSINAIPAAAPNALEPMTASCKSVIKRIVLMGGATIFLLFGLITAFLSYLCAAHSCSVVRRSLVSTAALGKVLTLSHVASHASALLLPVAMKVFSYQLAGWWLKDSEHVTRDGLPSPLQFGILLLVCGNANIVALVTALVYVHNARKRKMLPPATILKSSVAYLAALILLTYLITVSDVWLHASGFPVAVRRYTPLVDPATGVLPRNIDWGRYYNFTRCDALNADPNVQDFTKASCGQQWGGSAGNGPWLMEGLRTLSNSSDFNQVVYTNDSMAIIVPADLPKNITYKAPTFGVQAQCRSITRQCIDPSDIGPEAYLNIKCRGPDKFNETYLFKQGALDNNGNGIRGDQITSNPFNVGAVITSFAYGGTPDAPVGYHTFRDNTGWFSHGSGVYWNVVYCSLTTYHVIYSYSAIDSTFSTIYKRPTREELTRYVAALEFESLPPSPDQSFLVVPEATIAVKNIVDGIGLRMNASYEDAYALELSRQTLARGANLYIGLAPISAGHDITILGTQLDMAPLLIMLGLMMFYALFILFILIRVVSTASKVPFLQLASAQLTNALLVVHGLYGPKEPIHTWQIRAEERFGIETDNDRLVIGKWIDEDLVGPSQDASVNITRFGVRKVEATSHAYHKMAGSATF